MQQRARESRTRLLHGFGPRTLGSVVALLAFVPASAAAHGPTAPVATSYLARVTSAPQGIEAKVIDGYVRMWLRVPPRETVVVLDYRGAPYLRFSANGVQVNENSSMYYLNQTPVAATPPADLNARTPPSWHSASGGHAYEWHDGRLQALAGIALPPGATFVGRWRIPLVVDGHSAAISGSLWHREDPSIVWFWPIIVLLACVIAAWRVGSVDLDAQLARALGLACLAGVLIAGIGRSLHGRPEVSPPQWLELTLLVAFVGWGLWRVLTGNAGFFTYFVIGSVAVWEGLQVSPSLTNGYVLIALPPLLARIATVTCLGCGVSIMWPMFRLADRRPDRGKFREDEFDYVDEQGAADRS